MKCLPACAVMTALTVLFFPVLAPAAQRTFVASTGSDANPCALTAPCRSFSVCANVT